MKFPILASVILFIAILSIGIRRSNHRQAHALDDFFAKEAQANSVRKKSLDNLDYITIPESILSLKATDDTMKDTLETLHHLSSEKIVNFTGISNTDLKLTYGTANITVLTYYDQNYTLLARTLEKLAETLLKENRKAEAKEVLEFAVTTKTDVSATYKNLADVYIEENHKEMISELITKASELNSVMAPAILRCLEEKMK